MNSLNCQLYVKHKHKFKCKYAYILFIIWFHVGTYVLNTMKVLSEKILRYIFTRDHYDLITKANLRLYVLLRPDHIQYCHNASK